MSRVSIDLSVVLDLLLNRSPWVTEADAIWRAHVDGKLQALLAAFSLPTIFYIVRRQADLTAAHEAVRVCLETLEIIPTDRATLETAQTLAGSDFEDRLQIACALHGGAHAIVTRDPRGFSSSPIPVLSPTDLCNQFAFLNP